MGTEYLLALQQFRLSLPQWVETFFALFSSIGDGPVLVILTLIVYWCIDKRAGQLAILAFNLGNFCNQLIKNIACVYRPWIQDSRIIPAQASIEGAGGYSFPSGHTTGTATSLGSLAWAARKRHKIFGAVCIIVILLMMFSRNFLGVHTLSDVLVGLLIALVAIFLAQQLLNWMDCCDEQDPGHKKDILVAGIVIVLAIASVAYVILKPYPMDYVDGILLVDPIVMQKGSFEAAGLVIGVALGWVCERRWVGFNTEDLSLGTRIVRLIIGVVVALVFYVGIGTLFKALMPYNWAKFFSMIPFAFADVFLAPLLFKLVEKKRA